MRHLIAPSLDARGRTDLDPLIVAEGAAHSASKAEPQPPRYNILRRRAAASARSDVRPELPHCRPLTTSNVSLDRVENPRPSASPMPAVDLVVSGSPNCAASQPSARRRRGRLPDPQ